MGYPEETNETLQDTYDMIEDLKIDRAAVLKLIPYPGTPVYDTEYKNKVLTKKFEDFTQWQLVFNHKNLSAENLKSIVKKSYKEYYLRFSWLLKYFKIYII